MQNLKAQKMKQQKKTRLTPSERALVAETWHMAKARISYRLGIQTGYLTDEAKRQIDEDKWASNFSNVVAAVEHFEKMLAVHS